MNQEEVVKLIASDKTLPAIIGAVCTILIFILGLLTKDFFERKILSSKLETEHKFDERKKIKEVLAKYKVHLLTACEDFNHRMWNFANKHQEEWLNVNGDYFNNHYYFHSFVYRLLVIYAWTKKFQKEIIFLDTTIASKKDLEFVKFLNVFPRIFCDLTFLEGLKADGNKNEDHFYRDEFGLFADTLITQDGVKSFAVYLEDLGELQPALGRLYVFFDGLSPDENRKRWDRLHFMHLTVLMFLNNYGYDFQITNQEKLKKILEHPKRSNYLENYFSFLAEYHLTDNKKVRDLIKLTKVQTGLGYYLGLLDSRYAANAVYPLSGLSLAKPNLDPK